MSHARLLDAGPAARERLRAALREAERRLLAERDATGVWRGELAPSALAVAVAVCALDRLEAPYRAAAAAGRRWLCNHQNADGGWGDTVDSPSNPSTTLLAWAAFTNQPEPAACSRAANWIERHCGGLEPDRIVASVAAAYGEDRTFSAPILALLAAQQRLGADGWGDIPQLPFELAALPQKLFRWLQLPVVSYAIPALIAIGLVRHRHVPTRVSWLRDALTPKLLARLELLQPSSGGFLEAVPLTGFVILSLASCGPRRSPGSPPRG